MCRRKTFLYKLKLQNPNRDFRFSCKFPFDHEEQMYQCKYVEGRFICAGEVFLSDFACAC